MLVRTKLYPPRLPVHVVERSRLFPALNKGLYKPLTLVSGPAGCGKSTLIASWLPTIKRPAGWISLGQSDNDLRQFLLYLTAAVRGMLPDSCADLSMMLEGGAMPSLETLSATLSNELDDLEEDIVLVLDDYQLISNPQIHALVDQLLRYPPRPVHLVILTRADPPLALAGMRSKDLLGEVRYDDLRFDNAETSLFFTSAEDDLVLSQSDVKMLVEVSEGWAAGLQFALLALRHEPSLSQFLRSVAKGIPRASEYLLEEVLSKQPSEYQEWILQAAILDRFCAPLLEAACGPDERIDSEEFIAWLNSHNLFVFSIDDQQNWYRFHHLLADLLQHMLNQRFTAERISHIRVRAAGWLEENGFLEEALDQLLLTDTDKAVDLIVRHRDELFNTDQVGRVGAWLARLPTEEITKRAELIVIEMWFFLVNGKYQASTKLIPDLRRCLTDIPTGPHRVRLDAELDLIEACGDHFIGDFESATPKVTRALDNLPETARHPRGWARTILMQCLHQRGEGDQALMLGMDALQDESVQDQERRTTLFSLCFVSWQQADLARATNFANLLLEVSKGQETRSGVVNANWLLGLVHRDSGSFHDAVRCLGDVAEDRFPPVLARFTHATIALAQLHLMQGDRTETNRLIELMASKSTAYQSISLLDMTEALKAYVALRTGAQREALKWEETASPHVFGPHWRSFHIELVIVQTLIVAGTPASLMKATEVLREFMRFHQHSKRAMLDALLCESLLEDVNVEPEKSREAFSGALEIASKAGILAPFIDIELLRPGLIGRLIPNQKDAFAEQLSGLLNANSLVDVDRPDESQGIITQHPSDKLSRREMDVLRLLAEGQSNKEIGSNLFISPATVKRHTVNIYQKLDVDRRGKAVSKARSLGIIS